MEDLIHYTFTKYFYKVFKERIGHELDDDTAQYILEVCLTTKPHRKRDNHGVPSEYFVCRVFDKLITIVCDGTTHKIITCILETHHRKEFEGI